MFKINLKTGVYIQETLPEFLVGLKKVSIEDLSWTDKALGVSEYGFFDFTPNASLDNTLLYLVGNTGTTMSAVLTPIDMYIQCRPINRVHNTDTAIVVTHNIPAAVPTTIADAIVARTSTVLSIPNKAVHLLWSGGIDSTVVFYALLESGTPFTVIFNKASYDEYPMLAQKILDGEFATVTSEYNSATDAFDLAKYANDNPDALFVTGELADQMFGHGSLSRLTYAQRQLPVLQAITDGLMPQEVYDVSKDTVTELFGTELTLAEYTWALNFVYKYENVFFRMSKLGLKVYDDINTIHFYAGDEFQQYAMSNFRANCNFDEITKYKLPLKEYIFAANGDADYLANKTKVPSLNFTAYTV